MKLDKKKFEEVLTIFINIFLKGLKIIRTRAPGVSGVLRQDKVRTHSIKKGRVIKK